MPVLGCIADDFTGGTDLASNLVKSGFRVVLTTRLPEGPLPEVDALVVALKIRTVPVSEAVEEALKALDFLQQAGCQRFYFKYCSTFDSTPLGNIGPVTEALLERLSETHTILCPAFPDNGRTLYQGHLFVGNRLLNESGMQHHPLTPMTDPDLVRVLSAQSRLQVGLLSHDHVRKGPQAAGETLKTLSQQASLILTDALCNEDLHTLAEATSHLKLITGGSGLALGLKPPATHQEAHPFEWFEGRKAILAGSCSRATLQQLEHAKKIFPHLKLHPEQLASDLEGTLQTALDWCLNQPEDLPVLVYASGHPEEVQSAQERLGKQEAGHLIEHALSSLAILLSEQNFTRFIVAGGETSGAVVQALKVPYLQIGPAICPGVPWTATDRLNLALKSGNFGSERFFEEAWEVT